MLEAGLVLGGTAPELEGVNKRLTRSNSRSHTLMALKSSINTRPLCVKTGKVTLTYVHITTHTHNTTGTATLLKRHNTTLLLVLMEKMFIIYVLGKHIYLTLYLLIRLSMYLLIYLCTSISQNPSSRKKKQIPKPREP